jgi:hypothetical protein
MKPRREFNSEPFATNFSDSVMILTLACMLVTPIPAGAVCYRFGARSILFRMTVVAAGFASFDSTCFSPR